MCLLSYGVQDAQYHTAWAPLQLGAPKDGSVVWVVFLLPFLLTNRVGEGGCGILPLSPSVWS